MKYFIHPEGLFEIKIPLDWHYKNEADENTNQSTFGFQLNTKAQGYFQISCFHKSKQKINPNIPINSYNRNTLKFVLTELPNPELKTLLWATVVEDYFFIAKYVCEVTTINFKAIKKEIKKIESSLSTLMCLSPDLRPFAINSDKFEEFNTALVQSFNLKNKAVNKLSFIELIIVNANQVDAYLRLSILYKYQIIENTILFKEEFLCQDKDNESWMGKKIYDKAKEMDILSDEQHSILYKLCDLKNKIVHRYIITAMKPVELRKICYDYELICEEIRLVLAKIELEQFEKKVGYHGMKVPYRKQTPNSINKLLSAVYSKHSYKKFSGKK